MKPITIEEYMKLRDEVNKQFANQPCNYDIKDCVGFERCPYTGRCAVKDYLARRFS